jgi:hypothetical protein
MPSLSTAATPAEPVAAARRGRQPVSLMRVAILAVLAPGLAVSGPAAARPAKLRSGVGPRQPTPAETTKADDPFFAYLARVHLATARADRIVALRSGRLIEDAPAARLDARALGQIHERAAGPAAGVVGG